ncbi:potassium channel family protein [Lacticaseibacillus yichunensis]|uniref:Potassium channel family protein n=1 Tax=Lacticaseibacillus yichunensis TaxID=2486015 RepID=A0ABW4CME4_9LACO|nr:TrkA family potassium uptake protein [Lacticaseibacillus yichunensis]
MKNMPHSFAVFGLGRFGTSLVSHLAQADVEILAVDREMARVNTVVDQVDRCVTGDASDEALLKKLDIAQFDVVVFAMGEEFESSVMATMIAKELGAPHVVVKALAPRQAAILRRVGADQVVLPEVEMGAKVAQQLVDPNVLDVLDRAGVTISEQHPDEAWVGKNIIEADLRNRAGLNVLAVVRNGAVQVPVDVAQPLQASDILITLAASETE